MLYKTDFASPIVAPHSTWMHKLLLAKLAILPVPLVLELVRQIA
jgi:hypothetical protein